MWVIRQTGIKSLWGYMDFLILSVRSPTSIPEYNSFAHFWSSTLPTGALSLEAIVPTSWHCSANLSLVVTWGGGIYLFMDLAVIRDSSLGFWPPYCIVLSAQRRKRRPGTSSTKSFPLLMPYRIRVYSPCNPLFS